MMSLQRITVWIGIVLRSNQIRGIGRTEQEEGSVGNKMRKCVRTGSYIRTECVSERKGGRSVEVRRCAE